MHLEAQHLTLRDRVVPLQRFESSEIGVSSLEHTVVFDGEGRQVRVRGKVAGCFPSRSMRWKIGQCSSLG
jgi:hypothetical protein